MPGAARGLPSGCQSASTRTRTLLLPLVTARGSELGSALGGVGFVLAFLAAARSERVDCMAHVENWNRDTAVCTGADVSMQVVVNVEGVIAWMA